MTYTKHLATIAAIVITAGTGAASAADYVGRGGVIRDPGSIKDYRNVVPVPSPNPSNTPQRDWYVRGDLGFNFYSDDDAESHFFGGVGFGRYITPSFRADFTFEGKDSPSHDFAGLFNLYYDFERTRMLRPYIGIGLGGAKFNNVDANDSTFGFALAGTAGFTIDIAPSIKLDTSYRAMWSDAGGSEAIGDHVLRTGIRLDLYP